MIQIPQALSVTQNLSERNLSAAAKKYLPMKMICLPLEAPRSGLEFCPLLSYDHALVAFVVSSYSGEAKFSRLFHGMNPIRSKVNDE